jgi:hypothetical protein
MNDETNPVGATPELPPELPPPFAPLPPCRESRPLSYWLKKLLVCNPFYLASAALLLYGVYRLALDPNLFTTETRQLMFNFSALQCYELLLVFTATMLATRRIWYDATLLVVMENLLWIVPFILVSQAAFIASKLALWFCLLAVFLAVGRIGWVRTRAGELLPQLRVLWCAGPLVLINAAWPVVYRHFGESKLGINIASGAAYDFNEANWFWLLPTLATLLFALPRPVTSATSARLPRWFPLLLLGFWLAGTVVHLYSLGYIYDFKLRREQVAPGLWVLGWALSLRLADFINLTSRTLNRALLFLPLLATVPAAFVPESRVFFILSAVNFVGYGVLLLWQRDNELVLQLGLMSFAAMVAALPIDFAPLLGRPLTQTNLVALATLVYVIMGAIFSRNPKVALLGALAAMMVAGVARQTHADWIHWAMQAGFAYFLLHSLRWRDGEHHGATLVRVIVAAGWILHTFIWVRVGATVLESLVAASAVLLVWTARGLIFRLWQPVTVFVAAGFAMLGGPINFLMLKTQSAPAGLLYLVGSFALFGLGTLAALTKHRWHKHPAP